MKRFLSSPRWPLAMARLFAITGSLTSLAVAVSEGKAEFTTLIVVKVAIDAFVIWMMSRRRVRFAAALWFGTNAFVHLAWWAISRGEGLAPLLIAAPFASATAALIWPRLGASTEHQLLAPLSPTWALVATLLSVCIDAVLIQATGVAQREEALLQAGLTALVLFIGVTFVSSLGGLPAPMRWILQLAAPALAFSIAVADFGRPIPDAAGDVARAVLVIGLVGFALGLDWIRAGQTSTQRFVRGAALSLVAASLPLVVAAFSQPIGLRALLIVVARACVMGVVAAMMPRVSGRAGARRRSQTWRAAPPVPVLVPAVILLALAFFGGGPIAAAVVAPILVLAFVRTRWSRDTLFLLFTVPLLGIAIRSEWIAAGIPFFAGMLAIALIGFAFSGPAAARHFVRGRWATAAVPAPRASLGLATVASVGIAAWLAVSVLRSPAEAPSLLASVGGTVPMGQPILWEPPRLRDAPAPARLTGNAVAIDPLGRGTWIVDEERNEVTLMASDGRTRSVRVGAWPELLVVDRAGRVFVTCRQAGRVDVIDRSMSVASIPLGGEVRGLALHPEEQRLFVGLLLQREIVAIDTDKLQVIATRSVTEEPRTVAVNDLGIAMLPDRGSSVEFVSHDFSRNWREPLPANGRQAWHGQALVPAGRDLIALHAQVDTGLSSPVPAGGYGGSVSQPVLMVASILENGRARPAPFNAPGTRGLDVPDVTGVAVDSGRLFVATRGRGEVVSIALGRLHHPSGPEATTVLKGPGVAGVAVDATRVTTFAAFERVLISSNCTRGDCTGAQGALFDQMALPERFVRRLGRGRLDEELQLGRALFHDANDRRLSAAAVSCATCHADGREDGLVWRLQGQRLQTPSLAGRLRDTAPFNWHGTTPTLPENIEQTVQRLGGSGLEEKERKALARFIREGLRPVTLPSVADAVAVKRGRAVFNDSKVGCASCHDAATGFTDGEVHDVGSLANEELAELKAIAPDPGPSTGSFDTPSLRQVGITPPYFHDGSVPTLEALIERNNDRMGMTSHLSAEDRTALVAYLKTL